MENDERVAGGNADIETGQLLVIQRGEVLMEHDVRVAGGTADIVTGQLLVIKRCLLLLSYVITSVLIQAFFLLVVFYTSICYQSQSIHTQPTITVDTKPYSLKGCLCPFTFRNYNCLNIGLFVSSTLFYALIYNSTE